MSKNLFDKSAASSYSDRPFRQVPGYGDLLRMTTMLLAERVAPDGHILGLGAGGGLELKAMAEAQSSWRFTGVDPSAAMVEAARKVTAVYADRIALIEGYIENAPEKAFDGATCLLTFHFIAREKRLETLRQIRRRLKRGAPFIVAHISFTQDEPQRSQWIARHVTFGGGAFDADSIARAGQAMAAQLTILSPEEEESMLYEAGFGDIGLIYAGLSFRGWVAYA